MLEFNAEGTLGDTYIFVLKLISYGNVHIKVYHKTKHTYWFPEISAIYSLLPNVEVVLVEEFFKQNEYLTSDCHHSKVEFFPEFGISSEYEIENPYITVLPHSGKDKGGNCKELGLAYLQGLIDAAPEKVIVLGTKEKYSVLKNCTVIMDINILTAMSIVSKSSLFVGPEGLLSFVALSYRIKSMVYYSSYEAVEKRIVDTSWDNYCVLRPIIKEVLW